MNTGIGTTQLVALAALIVLCSCTASNEGPSNSGQPGTVRGTSLIISAVPVYRLLVYPDLPSASRLFIVKTRIEPIGDDLLHFTPADVHVTLADGTSGRVFDRARSWALIDSLPLAPTGSFTAAGNPVWTERLSPAIETQVKAEMYPAILDEAVFTRTEPIDGYLVVDTTRPSSSLNDVTLDIAVTRVSDETVLTERYQFGPPPAPSATDAAAAQP